MKGTGLILMMAMGMFMSITAMAHPGHKNVSKTQYNPHYRIKHGAQNGQLTQWEAAGLRMQQAKIRHYKQMAMADGRVTPTEWKLINRTQRNASRNIYYQKHDGQRRYR